MATHGPNRGARMLRTIDVHLRAEAEQLLQLQRRAYAQEAALINYPELPPLKETLEELMCCGETLLGSWQFSTLHAALGYMRDDEGLTICRLVVDPPQQRQGLAGCLLQATLQAADGVPVNVCTAAANLPALALYQRWGFMPVRHMLTPDGLALVLLQYPVPAKMAELPDVDHSP